MSLDCWEENVWPRVSWANRSFCKSAGLSPFAVPQGTFCINMATSHSGGWHTPIAGVLAAAPVSLHPPSPKRSPPQQSAIPFTFCVALITGSLGSEKCFPPEPCWNSSVLLLLWYLFIMKSHTSANFRIQMAVCVKHVYRECVHPQFPFLGGCLLEDKAWWN